MRSVRPGRTARKIRQLSAYPRRLADIKLWTAMLEGATAERKEFFNAKLKLSSSEAETLRKATGGGY